MSTTQKEENNLEFIKIEAGLLLQEPDYSFSNSYKTVTKVQPTANQLESLVFAQRVVKHLRSNGIVVAQGLKTVGISGGQTNRIWAAREAIGRALEKYRENLVLASDGFFPFKDVVEEAAQAGVKAIIQPGGSLKDHESIKSADENAIAMVFTTMRHFKH